MDPFDPANCNPFSRVGFKAFCEAREADPTVPPEDFVPNDPRQAEAYWNAVRRMQASTHDQKPLKSELIGAPSGQKTPKTIGHFHIRRLIATGGMGSVYEAMQESPRRIVAVKVMRPGMTSRSAMRRFQYESQLLARLRHPGIAQVYEAGMHPTELGEVPYFAMEYIANARPLTVYANRKNYETRERLRLFMDVCDAVHHGHQKGIIHRDLKPDNILVDTRGQVKIIDFGVARCTDSDLALTTLQTDWGQLIGTVQYMSPEQCEADPQDIDVRSDVYSLGIVLHVLLCGKLPYDVEEKPIHEVTRIVREDPPNRLGDINESFRGGVEAIVLRALEKERDRRYQSALDLATEIHRYLSGESISAKPPSSLNRLQFLGRQKKRFLRLYPLITCILMILTIATSVLYLNAVRKSNEYLISVFDEGIFEEMQKPEAQRNFNSFRMLIRKSRLDYSFADQLSPGVRDQFRILVADVIDHSGN